MLSRVASSSDDVSAKTSANNEASCAGRDCINWAAVSWEGGDNAALSADVLAAVEGTNEEDGELLLKAPAFSWFQFEAEARVSS